MAHIAMIAADAAPASPASRKRGAISWRKILLLAFILTCGVSNAHAQREFEISPFLGSRFGGKVDLTSQGISNTDYYKIKSSLNYGFIVDMSVWRNMRGEFMWNRQPTSLTAHNPNDFTYTFLSKMKLDTYLFGIGYEFRNSEKKFRPFIGLGFGFSHFGTPPSSSGPALLPFKNRPAYSLSGGVKYFFTRNIGIRTELRWAETDTTDGAVYCFPDYSMYAGCQKIANQAKQGQANVGLIFRFK
jgi:opacity protein-like surface antigen